MSKQLPQNGTYAAKLGGSIVVYETEEGALCAAVPVTLIGSDVAWSGKTTMTIGKSDGTLQRRTIDTLKKVFGWDGLDPAWLSENDLSACEFEIVGEQEEYTPRQTDDEPNPQPRLQFKIRWINEPGGGNRMPEPADRKAVMTKWGGKLKAISGGAAQKPAPASKPASAPSPASKPAQAAAQPPKPAAPPAPPAKKAPARSTDDPLAPTATMEEAWSACVKANEGKSEAEVGEVWYAKLEELHPGKTNSDLGLKDWGQVKAAFEAGS